jgi:hypothetical protein
VSAHVRAQILRFARVSAYALIAQLLLTGFAWPGWAGLWSLVLGAAETGLRQALPVKPLPRVASEPAAPPASQES